MKGEEKCAACHIGFWDTGYESLIVSYRKEQLNIWSCGVELNS